jgi:RNA polymerase-associated protein RTF1
MALTSPRSSVAASSPNSLGSGDMDESDSDREDNVPAKDSDVPYPLEGIYIDAKDKAKINALPQLERERILGERAEEANQAKWTSELARRAREAERSNALSDRKRKASSLEPEDAERKSSRQKTKGRTNDKLEAYKRDREQRDQRRQRMDDRRGRRSSSGDRDGESERDAEGESEPEYDEPVRSAPREEEPAQLTHFNSVRVGRAFFSEICFHPGFEEAMTGTFARIGVGQDSQRRTLYKMAQIKGMCNVSYATVLG